MLLKRSSILPLLCLILFSAGSLFAQTLQYSSPACKNQSTASPLWSNQPPGGVYSATPPGLVFAANGVINIGASATGTYNITYTGGSCNCLITSSIVILPVPVVSVSGNSVCSGETNQATVVATPSNGISYGWSHGSSLTNTNVLTYINPSQTYAVSVTDQFGCTGSTTFSLVNVAQTVSVTGASTLCSGSSVTLQAFGAASYSWSTGALGSQLIHSPFSSTEYTLHYQPSDICGNKVTKMVSVVPIPGFSVNSATVCSGQSATLSATSVTPAGTSFLWIPGSLSSTRIIQAPSVTTNYSVTANFNGCSLTRVAQILVRPTVPADAVQPVAAIVSATE